MFGSTHTLHLNTWASHACTRHNYGKTTSRAIQSRIDENVLRMKRTAREKKKSRSSSNNKIIKKKTYKKRDEENGKNVEIMM